MPPVHRAEQPMRKPSSSDPKAPDFWILLFTKSALVGMVAVLSGRFAKLHFLVSIGYILLVPLLVSAGLVLLFVPALVWLSWRRRR